jgi:hypothetical protein
LIVLAVLGAVIAASYAVSTTPEIDRRTLCETGGPTAVTAVLIDATDSISSLQKLAVSNRLKSLLKELRPNERVEIFSIRPSANFLQPEFSMCRPANADETSMWTANKSDADKQFSQRFLPSLNKTLDQLLETKPASSSPIMEAVQAATVRSLQASDLKSDDKGFQRKLILVSDLLQNSPILSQLNDPGSWESFKNSSAMHDVASDMTGTTVTVLYLSRDGSVTQGKRHAAFWDAWFSEQSAADVNVIPIEG